jgi:hypothetical protein
VIRGQGRHLSHGREDGTVLFDRADDDNGTRHPDTAKVVGGGVAVRARAGKGVQAHRESSGTLHTYVALTEPQDWCAGTDFTDAAGAAARIAKEFDGWAAERGLDESACSQCRCLWPWWAR